MPQQQKPKTSASQSQRKIDSTYAAKMGQNIDKVKANNMKSAPTKTPPKPKY